MLDNIDVFVMLRCKTNCRTLIVIQEEAHSSCSSSQINQGSIYRPSLGINVCASENLVIFIIELVMKPF